MAPVNTKTEYILVCLSLYLGQIQWVLQNKLRKRPELHIFLSIQYTHKNEDMTSVWIPISQVKNLSNMILAVERYVKPQLRPLSTQR